MVSNIFTFRGIDYYFSADYDGKKWLIECVRVNDGARYPVPAGTRKGYAFKYDGCKFYHNDGPRGLYCLLADAIKTEFMECYPARVIAAVTGQSWPY